MIPLHWQYNKKSTHRTLKRSGPFPNINTSSTENCLARWSSVQRVTWPHSKNWEAYRSCVCNKNLSHFTYYDNSQILCSRSSKCTYHYTFRQFLCIITPYYMVYTFQSGGRLVAWKLLIQCQDTVIIIFTVSKHVTLLIFYKNFMLM